MKILYVITKANWGGAQRYVYDLATAAKAEGHDVVVVYGEPGLLVERLEAAGVRTTALNSLVRDMGILREWRAFWTLYRTLRTERPNVTHLNSSKAAGLGGLAARFARVPHIIFTAHGWAFNEARPWWQKIIIYKLAWLTLLLSHTTICVSEAIRRDTRWMPFVRKKLVVIYNGTREPVYKTRDEARRALWPEHEGGYWVGMLSELHPTKRIDDAIEALALVRHERRDAKLIVLGEGQERARLETLVRERGLDDVVRLAGLVPSGDEYLRAFDLFLHTSRSEALSLAVIEAGLAGLPVVATSVGGIPEIIDDEETGLLVTPYAPKKVADALATLINEPGRAEHLGSALREQCRVRFDPERMVRKTLTLYEKRSQTSLVAGKV